PLRCVTQRARRVLGPARPLDGALRETIRPFDPEADADVGGGAFARGPGPHIVDPDAAHSVRVLEDVEVDAVAMLEGRARIRPAAREHALGVAEEEAERVEVMDAHDPERELSVRTDPIHPMRDGAHVDRREDGLAEKAAVE